MSWLGDLGLPFDPFNLPLNSMADIFPSKDMCRLEDAVVECVQQREMLIVLGPRGGGKTTTIYHTMEQSPKGNLHIVRDIGIAVEKLDIENIIEALLREIIPKTKYAGESLRNSRNARLHQLRRVLGEYSATHEVVLVLEDGHKFRPSTLINLKRLRELRFGLQERLLSVVILAQPQMRGILQDYEEVLLRSTIHEMQGLESEEVRNYIEFRLKKTGVKPSHLFTDAALTAISRSFHWPLEINYNLSRMLKEAAEVGDVPISEELAKRFCLTQSNLHSLFLLSGYSYTDLVHKLGRKKIAADRELVRRVIYGRDSKRTDVAEGLRQILTPRAGSMATLYDPVAPGITAEQRERLEKLHEVMMTKGDDFDFQEIARRSHLSQRRVMDILMGIDLIESELVAVERAVLKKAA
ncbi:MAG: AAA family ATPase [bacterium]|nr:AAA family ATPase [bacterium]